MKVANLPARSQKASVRLSSKMGSGSFQVSLRGIYIYIYLGSPVVPFYPFLGEGSPKIDNNKKSGTPIVTSLLEDPVYIYRLPGSSRAAWRLSEAPGDSARPGAALVAGGLGLRGAGGGLRRREGGWISTEWGARVERRGTVKKKLKGNLKRTSKTYWTGVGSHKDRMQKK